MREIFDIIVFLGLAYILFIVLRGFNETQTQKHIDKQESKGQEKDD